MGKVIVGFTMSLDGFIAGPNDEVGQIFKWYFSGDVAIPAPESAMVFKVAPASVEIIEDMLNNYGAVVTGRGDFNASNAWGGKSPMGVPIFIVTHNPPQEWLNTDAPFIFVTEGVERAIEQARQIAGDKHIAIGGTTITQQLLKAGLLDEIHISLAPVLLGEGIPLFKHLGIEPIELEIIKVLDAPDVTHIKYRVVK